MMRSSRSSGRTSHDLTGSVISFSDGDGSLLDALSVNITAQQSGSGDPSPTNVRPIIGFNSAVIHVSPAQTGGTVYEVSFGSAGTVFGGNLNVLTGELTVTKAGQASKWSAGVAEYAPSGNAFKRRTFALAQTGVAGAAHSQMNCIATYNTGTPTTTPYYYLRANGAYLYAWMPVDTDGDAEIQVVYDLETPQTYQLSPTQVATLIGQNYIWAECGDSALTYSTGQIPVVSEGRRGPVLYCWIKAMKDWSQLLRPAVLSWQLPDFSAGTDTGTVTVVGETNDYTGDWLILSGRPYVIKSCAPKGGATVITCQLPEWAFSRRIVYAGNGSEILGEFIADSILDGFIDEPDPEYAMPYLTVSNLDTTPFSMPAASGTLFSLTEIIRQAAARGVFLTWTPAVDGMEISVAARAQSSRNLFFADGHNQLVSQTYTANLIAKVTVREISEDPDTGAVTVLSSGDYYWHPDGSVSDVAPSPRIPGEWQTVDVQEGADLQTEAVKAMGKNDAGYKIEFWSDRDLQLYDAVTCRIGSLVVRAEITFRRRSSADRRSYYRAGAAAVTLTDKIKGVTSLAYLGSGPSSATLTLKGAPSSAVSWTGDASGSTELDANGEAEITLTAGAYVFTNTVEIDGVTYTAYELSRQIAGDAVVQLYPDNILYWYGRQVVDINQRSGYSSHGGNVYAMTASTNCISGTRTTAYNNNEGIGWGTADTVDTSGFSSLKCRQFLQWAGQTGNLFGGWGLSTAKSSDPITIQENLGGGGSAAASRDGTTTDTIEISAAGSYYLSGHAYRGYGNQGSVTYKIFALWLE